MKKSYLYLILFCFILTSCFDEDEPDFRIVECDGFDFGIIESDWILFPEGREYSFQGEGRTIELISRYDISPPFLIRINRSFNILGSQIGRECSTSFLSTHRSIDRSINIGNRIQNNNNGEFIFSTMGIDELQFDLEVVNDSILGTRLNPPSDILEPSTFQTFESMSIEGLNFANVLLITNPELEPREIYIARNLGLVALNRNDTLWLRN